MPRWKIKQGDCLDVLRGCPSDFFDAMLSDPPGGIEFCHEDWDSDKGGRHAWISWLSLRMAEALRTMKPGAYGAVWSFPRTSHWTGTALEEAGFEIRDKVCHLYAQGMGRGNNLKPSVEDWWIIRKPFKGSTKANVERHGVGRLNLDACRVPRDKENDVPGWHKSGAHGSEGFAGTGTFKIRDMEAEEIQERCGQKDRFPPNLVLDEAGAGFLEEQKKGLSRYYPVFYCPKPSRSEKEQGCQELPLRVLRRVNPGGLSNEPRFAPIEVHNNHKTVKPLGLARWLVKLISPPGGTVVDPFCGSGSLGCGALLEGFDFFGIEQDPAYCEIAEARLRHWAQQ